MTRYTEKQKLAAVAAYKKGAGGLRATASAHYVGVVSLVASSNRTIVWSNW